MIKIFKEKNFCSSSRTTKSTKVLVFENFRLYVICNYIAIRRQEDRLPIYFDICISNICITLKYISYILNVQKLAPNLVTDCFSRIFTITLHQ